MAKNQIKAKRLPPGSTEECARKFVERLCELMAAHEFVWRHGGQLEGAHAVKEQAIAEMVACLEKAGCLFISSGDKR